MLPTGDPTPFLNKVFHQLELDRIALDTYELDHICYRVASIDRYLHFKDLLNTCGELLVESQIKGRPIATFKLNKAISFRNRAINLLELPAPKEGKSYTEGYEHIEFVIQEDFQSLMEKYPHLSFDQSGINKAVNADIRIQYADFAVKFHHYNLEYVIKHLD